MTRTWCITFVGFALAATSVAAQGVAGERDGRLVVRSPHYDSPPPVWGSFSCPAHVVHLYGFERKRSGETPSRVVVQARTHPHSQAVEGDKAIEEAFLRLTHMWEAGAWQELSVEAPFVAITDESGAAEFAVKPGVYQIHVGKVGFLMGAGVIRVRPGVSDSLLVYLDQVVVCD